MENKCKINCRTWFAPPARRRRVLPRPAPPRLMCRLSRRLGYVLFVLLLLVWACFNSSVLARFGLRICIEANVTATTRKSANCRCVTQMWWPPARVGLFCSSTTLRVSNQSCPHFLPPSSPLSLLLHIPFCAFVLAFQQRCALPLTLPSALISDNSNHQPYHNPNS